MPPKIVKNPAEVGRYGKFFRTFEEFQAAFLSGTVARRQPEFQKQLQNVVRKCPKCSKSCGDVMVLCNGCGFDILVLSVHIQPTFSDYLFVAFRR